MHLTFWFLHWSEYPMFSKNIDFSDSDLRCSWLCWVCKQILKDWSVRLALEVYDILWGSSNQSWNAWGLLARALYSTCSVQAIWMKRDREQFTFWFKMILKRISSFRDQMCHSIAKLKVIETKLREALN